MDSLNSKPKRSQIQLQSNFFQLQTQVEIAKYRVKTVPEVPMNQLRIINNLLRQLRPQISEKLQPSFNNGTTLYSTSVIDDSLVYTATHEEQEYQVKIEPAGYLDQGSNSEKLNFLGRIFKMAQKGLKLKEIQRKLFNPAKSIAYPKYKLEIWPGFTSSVQMYQNEQIYVNLDLSFKILRLQSALNYFKDLQSSKMPFERIKEELIGSTVMTSYNQRMYRIDDITYDVKLTSQFTQNKKDFVQSQTTYLDYYKNQYNLDIKDLTQFLIVHKDQRTKKDIYLVPEFCFMTGLTDQMRSDFNLMKDISMTTQCDASKRLMTTKSLISDLSDPKNEAAYDIVKNWRINISDQPLPITGFKLDSGNLIMGQIKGGERTSISLESPDLERKSQTEMYQQPELKVWGIFCPASEKDTCQNFVQTMEQCVQTYKYPMSQPKIVYLEGRNFNEYKKQLSIINQNVQACVFLMAGPKKKAFGYDDIKNFMISEKGVPSQCVCIKTISSGKGLRSICNKILVQINAKVGGIPWTVDQMPFSDKPTMLFGIDVYHKLQGKSKKSVLAVVGTINKSFSKYWSTCRTQAPGQEIILDLQQSILQALEEFKKINNIYPVQIIIMRDGVSDSQREAVQSTEISAIRLAMNLVCPNSKLIFICINKRINAKFYLGDSLQKGTNSPAPGTLVETNVTEGDRDFYLISTKSNQGISTPTHYYLLVNDLEIKGNPNHNKRIMQEIQSLCYKQCFMYYNWLGSIKVPAPVQYAHKLSNLVGDKFDQQFTPHLGLGQVKSLYFI